MAEKVFISHPWGGWVSTLGVVSSSVGPTAAMEAADNQYTYSIAVSLSRIDRPGHLAPGEVLTAVSDANSYLVGIALPMNGMVASTGNSFIVTRNGYVIRTGTDGTSLTGYTIPVAHAANTVRASDNVDMIVIKDAAATPNEYCIATWEDNGNTADAMAFIVTSSGPTVVQDSDWFSNGSSANYLIALASPAQIPHKICQGPDGNVYITNGQYIATAVMTAGQSLGAATRTNQALNLGAGWVSSGICSFKNYVATIPHKATSYISGLSRGDVRVWLWDGFSPEPNFIYDIPDNYAKGIFYDGTTLSAITNGRNSSLKIFEFNGQQFVRTFESGFIPSGEQPLQGSMEAYQNALHLAYMANSNAHIAQYLEHGFHDRTVLLNGSTVATAVGMLRNLYQQQLFAGIAEGSSGTSPFRLLYQNQFTQYYVGAQWRSKLYRVPRNSKAVNISFLFSQFGSGASLQVSMFRGYDAMVIGGVDDLLNKTLTNNLLGSVRRWTANVNLTNIDSFYLNLVWNHAAVTNTAAIVQDIELDYIPTDSPA